MNDRLPEMLWAILIRQGFGQEKALGQFRRVLNFIGNHPKKSELHDLTLTGISKLDHALRSELVAFIAEPPPTNAVLQTLLLFENLPAREVWAEALQAPNPDLGLLMSAVGSTLWHQSQEATDCRWLRATAQIIAGRLHIPQEMVKEWLGYPNEGDQQSVRPSIRATEMAQNPLDPPDLTWPKAFWKEAWEHTPCIQLREPQPQAEIEVLVTRDRVRNVVGDLRAHWEATHTTTAIDAKHDGVFGMAFYSLQILDELMGIGVGTQILGRLGLRTILELRINLRFLVLQNDDDLWRKWRKYGAGQAKLSALKFDENIEAPRHINVENLERIANEDLWEEFVEIPLSGWSGLDLRKISERGDVKDAYDQYYSWTSGYAHGMWGAVRESCFCTCGNPLHRIHRYPQMQILPDVVEDAAELVDAILDELHTVFPSFTTRLIANARKHESSATIQNFNKPEPA